MSEIEKVPVKKKSRKKILIIISLFLLLIISTYVYYNYYFVYSEGSRVGILYKFSKKGTFFKTYEGEMVLPGIKPGTSTTGMSTNRFQFSVNNEELAKELMSKQGMELEVHYVNYNKGLPWRGDVYPPDDDQFVVDRLVLVKNESPNGYGL